MNRMSINGSALVLSVAMATAWPLSPAVADKGGTPHENGVHPIFGLAAPSDGPFPSDRFTELDKTQNTCQHVSLPVSLPAVDCASQPSECLERGMLNQFDGFNTKPRISIPFSGPIDLSTVDSTTVFLVALGNSVASGVPSCMLPPTGDEDEDDVLPAPDAGWVVGIDQGVWDPDANTLYVEAAELLDQHTKYVVVVTRGVKDATGMPVAPAKAFKRAMGDEADDDTVILDSRVLAYEHALRVAVKQLHYFGVRRHDIIAASVFTTMSVTAIAEKVRDQVNASPAPAPASFALGPNGARTVFPLSSITGITFNRQTKTTGPLSSNDVTATTLPVLRLIPGAISTVAYGRYDSINYLDFNASMAPVATFSGTPTQRGASQVYFNVTIPSGPKPAGGWPVAIFVHGNGDNLHGAAFKVASDFASHGIATLCYQQVGHGFGPATTLTVTRSGVPAIAFPVTGRSYDLDGNGTYDNGEGAIGAPGRTVLVYSRDPNRQNLADLVQLIRVIQAGMDVDGDGSPDIDSSRIFTTGISLGAIFLELAEAIEPRIRATVLNSTDGWYVLWLDPGGRGNFVGKYMQNRAPSLINPPGTPVVTQLGGFNVQPPFWNEAMPARGQAPQVNTVAGAIQIQNFLDRLEWLQADNAAGAYAVYLRLKPLPGVPARPFIIQEAKGDRSQTNPSQLTGIEAGLLADRVILYRHDLFSQKTAFKDPHTFMIRTDNTVMLNIALMAQDQISAFFNSNGETTIDPDGSGPLFEVPAVEIPTDFYFVL